MQPTQPIPVPLDVIQAALTYLDRCPHGAVRQIVDGLLTALTRAQNEAQAPVDPPPHP